MKEPDLFDVLMLNDDFTTMEFVVKVLKAVFFLTEAEAEQRMLQIHHEGKSVVGCYTLDTAESKVKKAADMARNEGFPLRLKVEPHK